MSGFRYFGRDTNQDDVYEIYRCPANGLALRKQDLSAVERLQSDGSWLGGFREVLVRDMMKGEFDEKKDELSEEQARAYVDKWLAEGWPTK